MQRNRQDVTETDWRIIVTKVNMQSHWHCLFQELARVNLTESGYACLLQSSPSHTSSGNFTFLNLRLGILYSDDFRWHHRQTCRVLCKSVHSRWTTVSPCVSQYTLAAERCNSPTLHSGYNTLQFQCCVLGLQHGIIPLLCWCSWYRAAVQVSTFEDE